ncbi:hypothetical protein E4U55_002570 [Claviceps digitariae]|nr:hypothetical protein E4U55_002570 [Claviceps digitariae]
MLLHAVWPAVFLAAACVADASLPLPLGVHLEEHLDSELANIRVLNADRVPGVVAFTYGSCAAGLPHESHHEIASAEIHTAHARLVWIVPRDAPSPGCVSAWNSTGGLVGRSRAQSLHAVKRHILKRAAKPIFMNQSNHFDSLGPWFDGIKFISQREPSVVDVQAAKAKEIAIVGAGISGLMTYLILQQSGFTNLTVLEANNRIGGRIHTAYLSGGPSNYSYEDLGAMKIPLDYTDPESGNSMNISDFQLVYALIEEMNRLNAENEDLQMDVIPWMDESDNGLQYYDEFRLPSGLPPTVRQVRQNASLARGREGMDLDTMGLRKKLNESLPSRKFMLKMANSMYKAHREWIDGGLGDKQKGDRWSEFAFLSQHLHGSLNSSDILSELDNTAGSFWTYIFNNFYEWADSWRTIDGGFSRLPESFRPLLGEDLRLNTKVERIDYDNNRLYIEWKQHWKNTTAQESDFDYAIITVPFTVVRQWRLPNIGATINNALHNLVYDSSCKVVLEYSERFWEHFPNPIYGGCSTETDIPGIGFACYPSYNINSTGPAPIIGSYVEGTVNHDISRMMTMSDEEHARYVLDAMTDIHGEHTRKLYTGRFARKCWALDPFTAGGWASPAAGQHELYMPEYFKMHSNMIFVGEHTSFTHGWLSSSLDSGIRGAVQLLLELGLVDEAKAAVRKWMAGWIKL